MMDALEYLKERNRMWDVSQVSVEVEEDENPAEAVRIVEEWSREHPKMTNARKFEEVFGVKYDPYEEYDDAVMLKLPPEWWDAEYKEPES